MCLGVDDVSMGMGDGRKHLGVVLCVVGEKREGSGERNLQSIINGPWAMAGRRYPLPLSELNPQGPGSNCGSNCGAGEKLLKVEGKGGGPLPGGSRSTERLCAA